MDSNAAFILFFIFLHLGKTELICDDSMVTLPNGLCLQLHKVKTTWTKAKVECQKQNGSLAAISNNMVDSFIRKYLNGSKITADVWLGAKTQKRWFWKDDGSELTWFAWGTGEPNDDQSGEDFVMLWQKADYLWNDQNGNTKENYKVISKFICEATNRSCPQNGECAVEEHDVSRCVYHSATCFYLEGYYGIGTSNDHANQAGITWADAEKSCKDKNQRLAHIENWSTLNALRRRIRADKNLAGNYWIGAAWDRKRGAKWTWENGDEVKYSNWNDKPVEQSDVVKAAKLSAGVGYKWDAENTNAENFYLCQYEPSIVVTTTPDFQTTNGLSTLQTTTTKRNPTTVLSSGVSSTEEPQTESTQVEAMRTTNVELDLTTRASALLKNLLSSTASSEPVSNEVAVLEDFSALEENQYQRDHDWGLAAAIGIPVLFAVIVLAVFSIIYTKHKSHPLRARLLGDLFTTVENPLYKAGLEDNPNPTIDKLKSYKGRRPFARDYDHSNVYQDHRIDTVSESCTDSSPIPPNNEIDSIYDTIESCTQDTKSPVVSETTCTGQNQPNENQRHLLGSVETSGGGGDVH